MTTLDAGTAFAGYRIESVAQEGPRVRVCRASQDDLRRTVVLHVALGDPASEEATGLVSLGRSLAELDDPHLVRVFEAGVADSVAYAVGADVGGSRLNDVGPLTPAAATALAAQLAPAFDSLRSAGVELPEVTLDDVVVVGEGPSSHAYCDVLGAYGRAHSSCLAPAAGLAHLLETMVANPVPDELRSVLSTSESFPSAQALADAAGAAVTPDRRGGRRWVVAAVALAAAAVIAVVLLVADRDDPGTAVSAAPADAPAARLVATIPLGGTPGSAAIGDDEVWVATAEGNVLRVDPRTTKVVGAPIRFAPKDPRNNVTVRAGGGLIFAVDGNRGTIVRIDQRSGRVTGRLRLGGQVSGATVSDGIVWALHWERRGGGARANLERIDAATLRPVGRRVPIPKARRIGPDAVDVEADHGVAWVLNSGYGTVMRYDSATDRVTTVKAGGAVLDSALRDGRLWVPDNGGGALVGLDARTLRMPDTALHPDHPLSVANGTDALWVESQRSNAGPGGPMRLYRVDPRRGVLVGRPVELGSDLGWIAAGFGAVWARSSPKQALLKLVPTSPAPAARAAPHAEGSPSPVVAGPLGRGTWATHGFGLPFTFSTASPGWILFQDARDAFELGRTDAPDADVFVGVPPQVFAPSGNVSDLRTSRHVLALIRSNPRLEVGPRRRTTFGGLPATSVTLRVRPARRYPNFCSAPCVALFNYPTATIGFEGASVTTVWVMRRAGRVVVATATRDPHSPHPDDVAQLVRTLRFR
jgi:hypothetical protein